MALNKPNIATQSTLELPSQDLRSRDASKPQVAAQLSSIRRSPSPQPSLGTHASHGLLSQPAPSPHVTRLSPPVGQFVINTLLQIAGFAAAIAFGIYAIQSVTVGKDANQSADVANQLALLGLCLQSNNQNDAVNSICSRIIYYASTVLPDLASTLFPHLPSTIPRSTTTSTFTGTVVATSTMPMPMPTPTAIPTLSGRPTGSGMLTAIIVGTLGGLLVIGLILFVWIRRKRSPKYGLATSMNAVPQEKKRSSQDSWSIMQSFKKLFVETRVITEPEG